MQIDCFVALTLFALTLFLSTDTVGGGLRRRGKASRKHSKTKREIQALLDPPFIGLETLLISRATPNTRLIRAFSLTNTFVNPSISMHSQFRADAEGLVRDATRDWPHFIHSTRDAVQATLPEPSNSLQFDHFIQSATLRIVLVGLLRVNLSMDELSTKDIDTSSFLINKLWTASKSAFTTIDPVELQRLNKCLRRLIPDANRYPNPLDFIVPAWETMWRVVATTVAHIEKDKRRDDLHDLMQDALDQGNFTVPHPTLSFSAMDCVNESIRLHPPSRRIARDTSVFRYPASLRPILQWFVPATIEVADIQAFYLAKEVWGGDANEFEPGRRRADRTLPSTSFAFGSQPMACVASRWAPIAAAAIAASVLEALNDSRYELQVGAQIGEREGWDGWSVRAAT